MQVDSINNQTSFMRFQEPNMQTKVYLAKHLSKSDIETFRQIIQKQMNNKVEAFLYVDKDMTLHCRLMCLYFLKGFKEFYKKYPIFETNIGFIKRISKRMDEYQARLDNAPKV